MSVSNPLHILFAEDEDSFRLALRRSLTEAGFLVEAVVSGRDAIAALGVQVFDVIVLDYQMPDGSGLNVLQWMLEQKDETPAIILTGAGSEDIVVEAMKLGAYDYIRKDQVDLRHIPIIINGVHERHLFRREKEQRNRDFRNRGSINGSIQAVEKAMISLSLVINNSLTLVFLNLQEFIRNHVVPYETAENQPRSQAAFDEIRKELEVVSSSMKSMLDLVSAIQGRVSADAMDARPKDVPQEKA
jgi:DNA-binding response OmpR family regulator